MPIVTVSSLKKSYGTQDLFDDVSFFVGDRERAALIGANGSGKTTILKIIKGEISADAGNVSKEPGITIGYLPQEVDLPDIAALHLAVMSVTPELFECASELARIESEMANASGKQARLLGQRYAEVNDRFDALYGFDRQIEATVILKGLGFDESDFNKPVQTLSGGQKTRAALARLLLLSPDMLLLDEPTNHLDIEACEWLQSFLLDRYQGAALIVSHDRYFMDRVVTKVVELDRKTAFTYPGNYHAFAEQKALRVEEERKQYKLQQKEINRLEQAIQTLFSHRKFNRRDSKVKQLQRIQPIERTSEQLSIQTNLTSATRSGHEVVKINSLSKSFPEQMLFENMDFTVLRGQKVGIVGPNGSGKTTLLKILAGRIPADGGDVVFGHNVEPVYFAQEFDHLVPSRTVLEELLSDANITSQQARDLLAQFLFMGDDAFKKVEVLSGGEMCRLALAKVLAVHPNLLLLDEPTNHLDIQSREALEEALRAYSGTIVVASHDRYLLDTVTNEILEIKDGAWKSFLGNYSYYKEKTSPAPEQPEKRVAVLKGIIEPAKRKDSPLRALERGLRELRKKRIITEDAIAEIEGRTQEITDALASEETYKDGSSGRLSKEYNELSMKLDSLYLEWESLCEEIGNHESQIREIEGSVESTDP